MLYQLPNGRTVYLTVEEFLDLTKEEEQYLISIGYGEVITDPWYASHLSKGEIKNTDNEDDLDITYTEEDLSNCIDTSDDFLDDLPDLSDLLENAPE